MIDLQVMDKFIACSLTILDGDGGGIDFLFGLDKVLPHLHINFKESEKEGVKTDDEQLRIYASMVTRSLFGNINASRNSA